MDSFEEWLASTQHASVQKYASLLIELGASWDTFLSRDADSVTLDLVKGGIPILAARDISEVATAAARQSQAPMAIFWDLENMPIPNTSSGRDVSSRLKSILKPYGDLVQFRGYASIGLNLIPQQKRSDLQLSGCLLVDCPHNGRKEVADKMIIVDAMNFAMQNKAGATLCFVTGDVDYAYLLAVLQRYKQYRTIVISKGTLQSMLDVNCDMKMRWETDILQLRSTKPACKNTVEDLGLSRDSSVSSDDGHKLNPLEIFEPLTADEEWMDDVQFLRNLIRREGATSGVVRKSLVGNLLRQTNPARFPNRDSVKSFLSKTIEKGVIWESGDGAFKEIGLPSDETTGMFPAISLSSQLPVSFDSIPERVIKAAVSRSYIIVIKWRFCPPGTNLPSNVFVQQRDLWGFLMFPTLTDAQRTVSEYPWLRKGFLVDWRKVNTDGWQNKVPATSTRGSMSTNASADKACTLCRAVRNEVALLPLNDGSADFACPECIAWEKTPEREKRAAARKAVTLMEWMAENDDITVAENILRKQIHIHKEFDCQSRKWAALWIKHAIEMGDLVIIKFPSNPKAKALCLASRLEEASRPFPPDDFDTSDEEDHILEILCTGERWMTRANFITILREKFPRMSHPYLRAKVLLNAHKSGRLYLSKSLRGHVIGLTAEDTQIGMASLGTETFLPENSQKEDRKTDANNSGSESSDDDENLRTFVRITQK